MIVAIDVIGLRHIHETRAAIPVDGQWAAHVGADVVVIVTRCLCIVAAQQIEVTQNDGNGEHALAAVANEMGVLGIDVAIVVVPRHSLIHVLILRIVHLNLDRLY